MNGLANTLFSSSPMIETSLLHHREKNLRGAVKKMVDFDARFNYRPRNCSTRACLSLRPDYQFIRADSMASHGGAIGALGKGELGQAKKSRAMVRLINRVPAKFLLVSLCVGSLAILGVPAASGQSASLASVAPTANSSDPAPTPPESAALAPGFKIGADDVLTINVWKEPEVSQTVTVRPDGKISLPLVGEVTATGVTPKQLEAMIANQLTNYLSRPEVTVIVHEVKSQRIVVAGQVAKPGSYPLQTPMTVLDAVAQAGGPLEFAKVKSIYVLRIGPDGRPIRLKFNYRDVIKGNKLNQNVRLESHDTVVVP
jgi:polysaccharide export outer membrane protein